MNLGDPSLQPNYTHHYNIVDVKNHDSAVYSVSIQTKSMVCMRVLIGCGNFSCIKNIYVSLLVKKSSFVRMVGLIVFFF